MEELKQVILVRKDLKMSPGKLAAQAAHASVDAVLKSNKKVISNWQSEGMKKIALKVENIEELRELISYANAKRMTTSIIQDAGHTELAPGTITCGAIGPDEEKEIDKITGHLKPF